MRLGQEKEIYQMRMLDELTGYMSYHSTQEGRTDLVLTFISCT